MSAFVVVILLNCVNFDTLCSPYNEIKVRIDSINQLEEFSYQHCSDSGLNGRTFKKCSKRQWSGCKLTMKDGQTLLSELSCINYDK